MSKTSNNSESRNRERKTIGNGSFNDPLNMIKIYLASVTPYFDLLLLQIKNT